MLNAQNGVSSVSPATLIVSTKYTKAEELKVIAVYGDNILLVEML